MGTLSLKEANKLVTRDTVSGTDHKYLAHDKIVHHRSALNLDGIRFCVCRVEM